jgi:hypothetical protein
MAGEVAEAPVDSRNYFPRAGDGIDVRLLGTKQPLGRGPDQRTLLEIQRIRLRAALLKNPAAAIEKFIHSFTFNENDTLSFGTRPDFAALEHVFIGLWQYWYLQKYKSLDTALGLRGHGRGQLTPKERFKKDERDDAIRAVYRWALQNLIRRRRQAARTVKIKGRATASERALKISARVSGIPVHVVRNIVHRKAKK